MATAPRAAVVDDDRLTRLLVRRSLEEAGYVVEEGDCGAAALRLALSRPDVMVLDLTLPDMSGLAVCRAVNQDTAVVILSADASDALTSQAYQSGAMDCLQKPVSSSELGERVGTAVRLRAEQSFPPGAPSGNSPPRGFRAARD